MPRACQQQCVQLMAQEASGAAGAVVTEAHDISADMCIMGRPVAQHSQLIELWLQEYKGAHGWGE